MNISIRKASLLAALTVVLICVLWCATPTRAYAVVNLGSVGMSMPGEAQLSTGETVTVSCVVTPSSSSQIPNCLADYCPSGCEAGGIQGCLDASGQCTCNGGGYTTYYPQVSVYSDNPGVARAGWSGDTLTITGYSPGTAYITATGSLRLFTPATQTIAVTVTDSSSGGGTGGYTPPKPSDSSGVSVEETGSPASSSPSVVRVGSTGALEGSQTGDLQVTQLVSDTDPSASADGVAAAGGTTMVASLSDASTNVHDLLAQIAGTANQVMFWAGSNEEEPDYVWYAKGSDIPKAPDGAVDLTVTDVTNTDRKAADATTDDNYVAIDATSCGKLPGKMTLLYRVARVFPNDSFVNVYELDEDTGQGTLLARNVQVKDGYVSIPVTEGAVFVICPEDSAGAALAGATSADEPSAEQAHDGVNTGLIAAIVAIVAAAVIVVAVVMTRRSKHKMASGAQVTGDVGQEEHEE